MSVSRLDQLQKYMINIKHQDNCGSHAEVFMFTKQESNGSINWEYRLKTKISDIVAERTITGKFICKPSTKEDPKAIDVKFHTSSAQEKYHRVYQFKRKE